MTKPTSTLSDAHRQRIQMRHKRSIERCGYHAQALFWTSAEVQLTRFKILAQLLPSPKRKVAFSLLDVGCGFGDLHAFLSHQGYDVNYTGIDLSADMVQSAGFKYPGIHVQQGEIFDFDFADNQFDYVFLSGALNEVVETGEDTAHEGRYAKAVIAEMYRIARLGVAFNLLDARNEMLYARQELQSFFPVEIQLYCRTFAARSWIQDDYLDNDFSIFLSKQP